MVQPRQVKTKRYLSGVIVANKMDRTVVVKVERRKMSRKYQKKYLTSKKYHVDDPAKSGQVGQSVTFYEIRPMAKTKRWRLLYDRQAPVKTDITAATQDDQPVNKKNI